MGCNCRKGTSAKQTPLSKSGSQGKVAKTIASLPRLITKKPVRQPNHKSN